MTLDYVQGAREDAVNSNLPERHCCTVVAGDMNVGEALLSRGLANVVYYRQDDDKRPSNYDALLAAEARAKEQKKGMHSDKKQSTGLRVSDVNVSALEFIGIVVSHLKFLSYIWMARVFLSNHF